MLLSLTLQDYPLLVYLAKEMSCQSLVFLQRTTCTMSWCTNNRSSPACFHQSLSCTLQKPRSRCILFSTSNTCAQDKLCKLSKTERRIRPKEANSHRENSGLSQLIIALEQPFLFTIVHHKKVLLATQDTIIANTHIHFSFHNSSSLVQFCQ